MWLLSTDRAELRWFTDAGAVPRGYAILSHTWGADEQTFTDLRAISKRCKASGKNPRDFVSPKIRNCCLLAERYGYKWVWIDTCCIDKTSSTELSEAINSMFKWYWQAEVCFAFLADVPSDGDLRAENSKFRESRWHTRGWTLQELIAPAVVIFFSMDWVRLGTKAELAELLDEVTHIPQRILTRKDYYHHTSVANRMRWAADRMTTREEDQAYCLMGLFDVNMTVIYGEGARAFRRLQHKIMKNGFSDMSLFAWGSCLSSGSFQNQGLELELGRDVDPYDDSSYLLAPSPSSFLDGFDFTPAHPNPMRRYPLLTVSAGYEQVKDHIDEHMPKRTGGDTAHRAPFDGGRVDSEVPTAMPNNYGNICRLPVFEADGVMVAVLLCENTSNEHVGLLINPECERYDPIRPMYFAGAAFNCLNDAEQQIPLAYRLVTLGNDLYNLKFNGKAVRASWRDIHIQAVPQVWYSPQTSIARLQLNCAIDPPFRIPHWLMAQFSMSGFQLVSQAGNEGELPLRLLLSAAPYGEFIHLDLGLCGGDHSQPATHWAKVLIHHDKDLSAWSTPHHTHDCENHHIALWSRGTKVFGDEPSVRAVQLSFSRCNLAVVTESRTLAVDIKLKGTVYADINDDRMEENSTEENPEDPMKEDSAKGMADPELPDSESALSASTGSLRHPLPTYILVFIAGAAFWPLLGAWFMVIVTAL